MAMWQPSWRRTIAAWAVFTACAASIMGVAFSTCQGVYHPVPIVEPTVAPASSLGASLQIKFADGSRVRLRDGRFVSLTNLDLTPLRAALARFPGTRIERLFQRSEAELDTESAAAEAGTGLSQPDLNLYYRLVLAEGVDPRSVIGALGRLPIVDRVYRDTLAQPS